MYGLGIYLRMYLSARSLPAPFPLSLFVWRGGPPIYLTPPLPQLLIILLLAVFLLNTICASLRCDHVWPPSYLCVASALLLYILPTRYGDDAVPSSIPIYVPPSCVYLPTTHRYN